MKFSDVKAKKLIDLLSFPCDFSFKVVAQMRETLGDDVIKVVEQVIKGDYQITSKLSAQGKYQSITLRIRADKIEHIERLYADLAQIDGVRMVL